MKIYICIAAILLSKLMIAQDTIKNLGLLAGRVQEAEVIVEGRIVTQQSFWNSDKSMILTSNYIVPLKWFKGSYADTIELLTIGGRVGDEFSRAMDAWGVNPQTDYFFFLKKMDRSYLHSERITYFPVNVENSAIVINPNLQGPSQEWHGIAYYDLPNELYRPVVQLVGSDYKNLGKNQRELEWEKQQKEMSKVKTKRDSLNSVAQQHRAIEYEFQGAHTIMDTGSDPHRKNRFEFNIRIQSMRIEKSEGEQFVSGVIFLEYDTIVLGAKLVTDGLFTANIGDDYARHGYVVQCTDTASGLIKILVSSKQDHATGLVPFGISALRLVHCRVTPKAISAMYSKLNFHFNLKLMKDGSAFYDDKTNTVRRYGQVTSLVSELHYR